MGKIFENLGIDGFEILFHAINLIILIVAMYLLLFKPVKKIIASRRQKLDDIRKENERMREETESMKSGYEEIKQKALEESAVISERAVARGNEIVEEAQKEAAAILENAQKEAVAEKQRVQHELYDSVGHIAVEIAEKILEREVSEEDNKRIIDESLSEWDK